MTMVKNITTQIKATTAAKITDATSVEKKIYIYDHTSII